MASIKTAISLPESLFEQAVAIASEMKISRSAVVAIALEEFIRRHQNRQLLEKINATYVDSPNEEEQAILRSMCKQQRLIVEGEC
ncbi:MAG TPA: hypothetical protein V6D12_17915 [Candidatus Obscuribacterales bacterium]